MLPPRVRVQPRQEQLPLRRLLLVPQGLRPLQGQRRLRQRLRVQVRDWSSWGCAGSGGCWRCRGSGSCC